MKIRADEHIAKRIVHIIHEFLSDGWELSHVASEGYKGTVDEYWITQFAHTGGQAIMSADTDFFTKPNQIVAIQKTGLKVIHLPAKWANSRCHLQAAHILFWWERIEHKMQECKQRECWQVPWGFNEKADLVKKDLGFQNAERKLKKQRKSLLHKNF